MVVHMALVALMSIGKLPSFAGATVLIVYFPFPSVLSPSFAERETPSSVAITDDIPGSASIVTIMGLLIVTVGLGEMVTLYMEDAMSAFPTDTSLDVPITEFEESSTSTEIIFVC